MVSDARIVLRGISWATYEKLAEEAGDQSIRMTYDRGILELISPSPLHGRYKKLFGRLVEDVLHRLRIPFEPAGESRWRREAAERGLEADECYFLSKEKLAIVGARSANRPDDPLPDLAIEIELSEPEIDRPAIYAALGVPEVWHFNGERLRIERLRADGVYEEVPESGFIPLVSEEMVEWVLAGASSDFIMWLDRLHEWIREEVVKRPRASR
jgi:Uma2 family endonuclease